MKEGVTTPTLVVKLTLERPLTQIEWHTQNTHTLQPTTQAAVKEGVTTPTLVVKLTLERPCKGSPGFVDQVLGLVEVQQVRGGPALTGV